MTEDTFKRYFHNPPHLFVANVKYFITGSTYLKKPFLKNDEAKASLLYSMNKGFNDKDWKLEEWVILDNHYHIMVQAPGDPASLPLIIRDIHRFNSLKLKKLFSDLKNETTIWYNYWDTCISYENSYWARIHYLWFNPLYHGYVNDPADWKLGSYYDRVRGDEQTTRDLIKKYPCDHIELDDNF